MLDDALLAAWRSKVERAGARLRWADIRSVARRHAGGVSLAISAPCDQLFLATEVNEWALCAVLVERDPVQWGGLEDALIAQAAEAAEAGMRATIPMQARKGRASYLGERSIGHQDPGATSTAMIIRALERTVAGTP